VRGAESNYQTGDILSADDNVWGAGGYQLMSGISE
jgi:hypothetical protein